MILDKQNMFSEAQAITADAVSTNIVDLGPEGGDGAGRKVVVSLPEAFNTLTSLIIELQSDDNSAMSSAVVKASSGPIPLASLVAGASFEIPIPAGFERYMRLNYDVVGTNPTTGKVTAGIVLDYQSNG